MNFFEMRIVSQRSQGLPSRNRIVRRIVVSRIVAECDAQTGQTASILSCVDLSTYDFANIGMAAGTWGLYAKRSLG